MSARHVELPDQAQFLSYQYDFQDRSSDDDMCKRAPREFASYVWYRPFKVGLFCFAILLIVGAVSYGLLLWCSYHYTYLMLDINYSFDKDFEKCEPATARVSWLRKQAWPSSAEPSVPKISEVIYINLDTDKPRRDFMEQQFSNIRSRGIDVELIRFPAITKSQVANSTEWEGWRTKGWAKTSYPNINGNLGVAACAASHYRVLQKLLDREHELLARNEVVVVAEDDVEFSSNFLDVWNMLWRYIPDDWDLVRIGWYGDNDICSNRINKHVDRAGWVADPEKCHYCGTQAHIPRPGHISKLLNRFEQSKITHADILLSAPAPPLENTSVVRELAIYATLPLIAFTHRNALATEVFNSDRDNDISVVKPWYAPR